MFGHQLLQRLVYFTQAYLSLARSANALSTRLWTGALVVLLCCIAGQCIISVAVNHGVVIVVRYVPPFSAKKGQSAVFFSPSRIFKTAL